ncbi:hypothetical protein AVEN_47346-1 [Araneus ventricosus]|uniref:Uncharacterized protein n=1 Tax=Araneus ventricosus TaxID=182803 RepID=A0A4Y2F9S4_ARAVE|nr:hypothetical protein AVEN_47346-1 [Araneus ventricosus]
MVFCGPRCEASGKTIVLPRLGPHVEGRNGTRNPPCGGRGESGEKNCATEPSLKTNFGTSVNALPNFSTKMGGKKNGLRTTGLSSLLVNAQLKTLFA